MNRDEATKLSFWRTAMELSQSAKCAHSLARFPLRSMPAAPRPRRSAAPALQRRLAVAGLGRNRPEFPASTGTGDATIKTTNNLSTKIPHCAAPRTADPLAPTALTSARAASTTKGQRGQERLGGRQLGADSAALAQAWRSRTRRAGLPSGRTLQVPATGPPCGCH